MCLEQLRVVFARVGAPWLPRECFQALYLWQYSEVQERFSCSVCDCVAYTQPLD